MGRARQICPSLEDHLRLTRPDHPVIYAAPPALQRNARRFIDGFPGLVTYAVKANSDDLVLGNLSAAGVRAFDVASPHEMELVCRAAPEAAMHYNNPVRSRQEILRGLEVGVASWSVDSSSELSKLADHVPPGAEVAVRFKLPVGGAAYDFGAKFGATADQAVVLLQEVAALGYEPALTFHPGTQCTDPGAWVRYIESAAAIADVAGIAPRRVNVGGGFPSHRQRGQPPCLDAIFHAIARTTERAFGAPAPTLVCEPGRALVADAFALATRIKAIRDGAHVFLNDGIYGGLSEAPVMGNLERIMVLSPDGAPRTAPPLERTVFGPTCDSLDRLPGTVRMPSDAAEGDYVIFRGVGAYSTATATRFNGYGLLERVTVLSLGA